MFLYETRETDEWEICLLRYTQNEPERRDLSQLRSENYLIE